MFGAFRGIEGAGRVRILRDELRRAILERAAEADRAADLGDELEGAWREAEALRAEVRALRDEARALRDDAGADAARSARLEGERDAARAAARRAAPARRRLLAAIRLGDALLARAESAEADRDAAIETLAGGAC